MVDAMEEASADVGNALLGIVSWADQGVTAVLDERGQARRVLCWKGKRNRF
jgi:hypothetical protein